VCGQVVASLPAVELPALEQTEAELDRVREALEGARRGRGAKRLEAERLLADGRASGQRLGELRSRAEDLRRSELEVRQALQAAGFGPIEMADPDDLRQRVEGELARLGAGQKRRDRQERERVRLEDEAARLDRDAVTARTRAEAAATRLAQLEARRSDVESAFSEARGALTRLALAHGWETLRDEDDGPDEVVLLEQRLSESQRRITELAGDVERLRKEQELLERGIARAAELRAARERLVSEAALAGTLAQLLQANQLVAHIQEEALARLARDASQHLLALSRGRYSLVCDEQEYLVLDHWHADTRRSVRTLSGGETFLAALALALALAESLVSLSAQGRAGESLESLFLDEGFGTLDSEALDLVVQAIESLHGGRRMVGVVTHIPELAERLPARLRVERGAGGASVVVT
jgi:exonuclease SbcC